MEESSDPQLAKWRKDARRNPLWPLPKDYERLDQDGQRQARLAVVRRQGNDKEFVVAWEFFSHYYLNWEGSGFYRGHCATSNFHRTMLRDMARYPLNMISGPRNSAKTTTLKSVLLFLAMTRPKLGVLWVKSNADAAKRDFLDLMIQIDDNRRIIDDFGKMKRPRGEGSWSRKFIYLANGFWMVGTAIESANRGHRPPIAILDDVEFDDENPQRADELTKITEDKMKFVFLPMMELKDTSLFFIGTTRMNSYLFRAMHSKDPTMDYWNRRHVKIKSDAGLYWPEKFGEKEIKQLRGRLGNAAFSSEYMGEPQPDELATLPFSTEYHTYQIKGSEADWDEDPWGSQNQIHRRVRSNIDRGIREHTREYDAGRVLNSGFRFITVDYAMARSHTSDFSGAAVWLLDHEATLWSLDLWLRRATEPELMDKIVELAIKWRVRLIAPENIAVQTHLAELIRNTLDEKFREHCGYVPFVMPLRGKDFLSSKAQRICTVQWRFTQDRIVLPEHRLDKWPYREFKNQIMAFNGDTECMKFDDAIDMLGMTTMVLRNRSVNSPTEKAQESWISQAAEDPRLRAAGINPFFCIDINSVPVDDLAKVEKEGERKSSSLARPRPRYVLSRRGIPRPVNSPQDVDSAMRKTECGWVPIIQPLYPK